MGDTGDAALPVVSGAEGVLSRKDAAVVSMNATSATGSSVPGEESDSFIGADKGGGVGFLRQSGL
jgi:hypothetical protein